MTLGREVIPIKSKSKITYSSKWSWTKDKEVVFRTFRNGRRHTSAIFPLGTERPRMLYIAQQQLKHFKLPKSLLKQRQFEELLIIHSRFPQSKTILETQEGGTNQKTEKEVTGKQ